MPENLENKNNTHIDAIKKQIEEANAEIEKATARRKERQPKIETAKAAEKSAPLKKEKPAKKEKKSLAPQDPSILKAWQGKAAEESKKRQEERKENKTALKAERNAARKEHAGRVFSNAKEQADKVRGQIKKYFEEDDWEAAEREAREQKKNEPKSSKKEAEKPTAKQEHRTPQEMLKELESAYARLQASLVGASDTLTPDQIRTESERILGPLKADAERLAKAHGLPLGNFPEIQIPGKGESVPFTGTTQWEENTHPSYVPYRAPLLSDYPTEEELGKIKSKKDTKTISGPKAGEKVNTDWEGIAANIRNNRPEIVEKGIAMRDAEQAAAERSKAETTFNELRTAYSRLQSSLTLSGLTENQIAAEHMKSLEPLRLDAQKLADEYGFSMDSFTETKAPEKEEAVPFTGTTQWEENTHPSYKPYRAPRLDDHKILNKKDTKKLPEQEKEPTVRDLRDLILKTLQLENQTFEGTVGKDERIFANSQKVGALDQQIFELGAKLGINESELKELARHIAEQNGLKYFAPEDTEGHPDVEAEKAKKVGESLFDTFMAGQELGARVTANREGLFWGQKPTGVPDEPTAPKAPKPDDAPAVPPREKKDFELELYREAERTVPGFKDLTDGQKNLTMRGVHSRMLEAIKEKAAAEFAERVSKKNWFGQKWDQLNRSTITGAYEKLEFIKLGGEETEEKKGLWNKLKSKATPRSEKIWKDADQNIAEAEIIHNRKEFLAENTADIVDVMKSTGLDVAYWNPVIGKRGEVVRNKYGEYEKGAPVANYAGEPDIRNKNINPDHPNYKMGDIISDTRSQIVFNYNAAATEMSNIPAEWGTPDATREQHKAYTETQAKFEEAKTEYMLELENYNREHSPDVAKENYEKASEALKAIDPSWGNPAAKKAERRTYNAAKEAFDKAKNTLNEVDTKYFSREPRIDAAVHVMETQALAEAMRFVYTHPEAGKQLKEIGTRTSLQFSASDDATKERLGLMGLGYGMRQGAVLGGLTVVGAPIVGGVIGALRGKFRSEEALAKIGKLRRRGERMSIKGVPEKDSEEWKKGGWAKYSEEEIEAIEKQNEAMRKQNKLTFGMGDIKKHIDRLDDYDNKLSSVFINREERGQLLTELETRVNFMETKIELGQMNFGRNVGTQLTFMQKLLNAHFLVEEFRKAEKVEENYRFGLLFDEIKQINSEKDQHKRDTLFEKLETSYELKGLRHLYKNDDPAKQYDTEHLISRARGMMESRLAEYRQKMLNEEGEVNNKHKLRGLLENGPINPKTNKSLQEETETKRIWKVRTDAAKSAIYGAMFSAAGEAVASYGPHFGWSEHGTESSTAPASNEAVPNNALRDTITAPRATPPADSLAQPQDSLINNAPNTPIAPTDTLNNAPIAPANADSVLNTPEDAFINHNLDNLPNHPYNETEILNEIKRARAEHQKIDPEMLFNKNTPPRPQLHENHAPAHLNNKGEVYESYDDPKAFGLEGHAMRHADRVMLRMLDKDWGAHHGPFSRHTIDRPEWIAIENFPVKRALLAEGGVMIHSHKQFFDTLRSHGLKYNILPKKDETIGSYTERVYAEMAKERVTGTETDDE